MWNNDHSISGILLVGFSGRSCTAFYLPAAVHNCKWVALSVFLEMLVLCFGCEIHFTKKILAEH